MHEGFDGRRQRSALTAAEQTLRALGAGEAAKARKAAAKAFGLDQIGVYSSLVGTVAPLAERLDGGEAVDDAGWDSLAEVIGGGPLGGLIDQLRG